MDIVNGANNAVDGSISASDNSHGAYMVNFVFGQGTVPAVQLCKYGTVTGAVAGAVADATTLTPRKQDFWRNDKNHYMVHGTHAGYQDNCWHNDVNGHCN